MGRNKIIIVGLLLIALIVILSGLVLHSHSSKTTKAAPVVKTVTDQKTGAQFYKNDPETPESNGQVQVASVVGGDTIINDVTDNQFTVIRQLLSDYLRLRDTPSISLIKFDPSSIQVDGNNNITGQFSTDKGTTTYDYTILIASINSLEITLADTKNPGTIVYNSGYVDTSGLSNNEPDSGQ